eukprot:s897_g14.t1
MYVVSMEQLLKMTEVRPHERLLAEGIVVEFRDNMGKALFVSHQWVGTQHPDPEGTQLRVLQQALRFAMSEMKYIPLDFVTELSIPSAKGLPAAALLSNPVFVWYDYFSCPQLEGTQQEDPPPGRNGPRLTLADAISSIPTYIAACSFFVALCPIIQLPQQSQVLSPGTWAGHRREDVLARGRRASVVAGPSPEGASNFPGTCTLELPCAEAGRVLSFVGVGCEGRLPCMLCVGACDFHGTVVQYQELPAKLANGLRERGQPLRAGAFSYKREAFATVEKPVLQASEAADVAQEGGRPAPDAKKSAAASVRHRKIPGELERHVVPGDGSCLFHCLAQALPAVASHDQARAETIAHMRKYTSYKKRWDGCDDRQQHLESYADYLIRMQAPDAQAGALEILAAAKTHKCTIVVLPERADMPPSAFNYGPSYPKVIVWHTGQHFDLLTLKANARLPDEIAAVAEEAGQGSFPRVGGPSAVDLAGAEGAGPAPGAPGSTISACASVASSAPTSVKLRAKRARVGPPAGTPSIRSFFDPPPAAAVVTAGPVDDGDCLAPGTAAPGSPADSLQDCMPPEIEDSARPRYDSRGRLLKGRTIKAKDHWKCDWCDYVVRGKHWCAYRHAHLKAWHPEHLQDFGPRPPRFVIPGPTDAVEWPCPFCAKALLKEPSPRSLTVMLRARLRHREQCHPEIAKRHFLLPQARSGAQKATAARLADGVARRILMRRKGDFGSHDVRFFRIPWTGKPAKKPRSTRVVYACVSCAATAATPKQMQALPCERRPATSSHTRFVGRVRALIAEGKHDAPLLAGCRQLLGCISPDEPDHRRLPRKTLPPPALRAHDVVAVAWPFLRGGRHVIELRFLCLRCAACRKNRRALEKQKACDAVVRGGARIRRELTHASEDPDATVARTAMHVLQLLDRVLPTPAAAPPAPKEVIALADAGTAGLTSGDRGAPTDSLPLLPAAPAAAPSSLCAGRSP